jgi:hypothetical protein
VLFFPADEHARQLEERWIDGLEGGTATGTGLGATTGDDGNGDGDPNIDGNTTARPSPVVLGLITGFFFPIAPLFFLKDAVQPYAWANGAPVETQMSVIFGWVASHFKLLHFSSLFKLLLVEWRCGMSHVLTSDDD